MKSRTRNMLFMLALLGVALALLLHSGLHQYLSLAELKNAQTAFAQRYAEQPVQTTLLYFVCFTALTACCLPGASVLMFLAGASFGILWGSIVAVLASALGATITMLASRYLLRRQVEARYGNTLAEVNRGLADGAALYLLSLRLLPVVPYVPLNLLCGLTRLSLMVFFLTGLIGMLPATVLYVNAGVQLGSAQSLGDVLSPNLFGGLVLLGLLPLATKVALRNKNKFK